MTDAIKLAARVALIAVITLGIVALFAVLQFPAISFTVITQGLGTIYAIFNYYLPTAGAFMPLIFIALGIIVAIKAFEIGILGVRWVWKVNE